MDKYVRDQIVEILSTVKDAIQHIRSVADQKDLIEDCTVALKSIDQSCKFGLTKERYAYYQQIFDGVVDSLTETKNLKISDKEMNEVCTLSYELLQFAAKELLKETEVKKEIVFLPYKASMWDSLESIWLAAKEDSECNTYVIPIPYYDLGPNKEAIAMHYEGEQFPEYVPITDYQKYDMGKRKPDIIYIHNPYDGYNRVTSVHPDYYSAELKKYTDMLVYVPYFLTGGLFPEAQTTAFPCYQNMDKMIVQNSMMPILPINHMEKNEKYLRDYIPAEKLVPLGSPKLDRVFYCEKNKKIPKEWQEIIGSKKVVLYNVSLSGLLQFGEQALRKIQYVFNCFMENQEVVLLWRPHPLIHATLNSMRPDLYHIYKELEKQFINQKIGILDTTPDIDMAVAIADAYLGEESSSVVHLFGASGKPIFITDMAVTYTPNEEEKASLLFGEYSAEGENLWFVADGYNVLCKMHLPSGKITPLYQFDNFSIHGGRYSKPLRKGNRLILSPLNAKEICDYNLDTKEVKMISLEEPLAWGNFGRSVCYQQYIFMMPYRYPAILRYDLRNGQCTYYTDCIQELLQYRTSDHDELFVGFCVRENKILAPTLLTNKVLEFDMNTGNYKFHTIGPNDANYANIIDDGRAYWLIPWTTKSIVRWNYMTGQTKEYHDYPENFTCAADWNTGDTYMFSGTAYNNGSIWFFPGLSNMIMRLDIATGQIKKVNLPLPYEENTCKSQFYIQQNNYFSISNYGNKYVISLSSYDRSMLVIDTTTENCWLIPCRLSPEDIQKLSRPMRESFGKIRKDATYVATENNLWRTIETFLNYVVSESHDQQAQKDSYANFIENMDGTCGEKVHQYIMKQIRG